MKLAKVVAVRPGNKVDLVFLDNGQRVPGVPVMADLASSSSGQLGLVTPDAQGEADPYDAPSRSGRDLIACVGFYGPAPVVQGFLFPEVSEMIFEDKDRYLLRTASDFVHTVDGNGNAEWWHPGGAYIRMGESAAHDDLTGRDLNGKFRPSRNAERQVHIHIAQAGGTATVDISPNGKITIVGQNDLQADIEGSTAVTIGGNATIDVGGDLAATVGGTTLIESGGQITIKAPSVLADVPTWRFTGMVTVDKLLTYKGGMAGSGGVGAGGSGATAKIQGNIEIENGTISLTGGDVVADTISLKQHVHKEQGDGQDVGKPKP